MGIFLVSVTQNIPHFQPSNISNSFVCIAFVYFLIYETKGLSLEEVDELYARVSQAWKSQNFQPEISFQDIKVGHEGQRGESIAEAVERKTSVTHHEA